MKNVMMLALALAVACGTGVFGQEEPLEPIPLPAPLGKADDASNDDRVSPAVVEAALQTESGFPLEGPVFPESSVIVDENSLAPIEIEQYGQPSVRQSPTVQSPTVQSPTVQFYGSTVPPVVYESAPAPGEVVVTPGQPQAQPGPTYYAVPQQPGVRYERPYYQTVPSYNLGAAVTVYHSPFGRTSVGVTRVAPASYTVDVQIPARTMSPFGMYRSGYAPAGFGPAAFRPGPMMAPPFPMPFMPGRPIRNMMRSMMW